MVEELIQSGARIRDDPQFVEDILAGMQSDLDAVKKGWQEGKT